MSMAGVFVIVSAILKQVFYWRDIFSTEYINWTIREAATSVYVGNMAYLWTFCRQCFGFGSLDGGSAGGSRNYAKAGSSATGRSGQRSQGGYKMEVTSTTRPYRRTSIYGKSSESEESINGAHAESVPPGEIRTDVTFAVDIEDSHPRPSTMTQGSNDSSTLGIVNPQGRLREEVWLVPSIWWLFFLGPASRACGPLCEQGLNDTI